MGVVAVLAVVVARLLAAGAFVLFAFGLLGARLVYLQVYKHEELSTQAENNRIAVVPVVPNRGLIVDRNGVVLAHNYSAYTLEITPAKVTELIKSDSAKWKKVIDDAGIKGASRIDWAAWAAFGVTLYAGLSMVTNAPLSTE